MTTPAPRRENEIDSRDAAMLILGGIRAIDRLTKVADSEVMRTMIAFRDEKLFEDHSATHAL
jgi:hypothetical protein